MHAERKSSGKSKTVRSGRICSQVAIEPIKKEVVYVSPPKNKIMRQARLAAFGIFVVVCAALTLGSEQVQAAPVCSNTPTAGDRVYCEELQASTNNINIDLDGVIIDTTGDREQGAAGIHRGTGKITIDIEDSSFTTQGELAEGVYGWHAGTGDVDIDLRNITSHTHGLEANGVYAWKTVGNGNINIDVTGSMITTEGGRSYGIRGQQDQSGYVDINVSDGTTVLTKGTGSHGIIGWHRADITQQDNIDINVQDSSITTEGSGSNGIFGYHAKGKGDIDIFVQGGSTTTQGFLSHGIVAWHQLNDVVAAQTGDIVINTRDHIITTGDEVDPMYLDTLSFGIYAKHESIGDITIDARGGSITTGGVGSHGIYGTHENDGDLMIDTSGGHIITTTGANSHGIVAYHTGTMDPRSMAITVEGSVNAIGAGSQGVRVGTLANGAPARVASFDMDGYRDQTVTVNGPVTSNGEGVFLAGGGRVVIGPQGSIDSDSGIAILATGEVPADDTAMTPAIQPKLWVDLNLGGRRVAQAIDDNWIINDGGETTIAVNRTVLHDGEKGVTGDTAHNGAWNVRMRKHGVKVVDSTVDRVNWTFTPSTDTDKIIKDRDFSADDFTETRRPIPPPPSCPDGQVGTPPDCTDAETNTDTDTDTEMPMFMEEYAPRSAVYESLPGFLLRMADRGRLNHRPVSPVWMVFSGGDGSVDPSRSTTGAEYDYDRYRVQLGKNLSFGEGLDGWFAVHYTQGDSEVSSPTGGGGIDAEGAGATFNIQWQHDSGYYLGGRASLTNYDIDLSSDDLGRLKSSVDALGTSLGLETGMRLAMGETLHLTPRAWLSHSSIDIDSFTDAVDAKASFPDEVRLTGGIGALAETMRHWNGGQLTWHGSLDLEQMLNSRSTRVDVSGEKLKTETVSTRMLLGLGSLYRKGDFSISAQVAASGLGTNDEEYSGQVNIGVRL